MIIGLLNKLFRSSVEVVEDEEFLKRVEKQSKEFWGDSYWYAYGLNKGEE